MSAFDKVLELGKKKFGLEVKFKDESVFMKSLGVVLFFNPRFMTRYSTTVGNVVYFPSRSWLNDNKNSAARVLAHELVHISDATDAGSVLFSYAYLTPQVFALLSLLAFVHSPWWLLCMLFLAPIPAPMRTYWELRGYAITDAVQYKSTGSFTNIDWMIKQFSGSAYFFMWPFKKDIRNRILTNRSLIQEGKLNEKIDFADEIIGCF